MEYRLLEINLISADGLKDVNMFGKMDVYAVAFISGYPSTKKKTSVDKNCGASPRWNQKLQFTVDERLLSNPGAILIIQLKAEKPLGLDKDIGQVSVPLSELFSNGGGAERVVEYQVRTSSGKSKGSLKISYKFGAKESYNSGKQTSKADEPVTAYPPSGYKQGQAGSSTTTPVAPAGVAMAYPPPNIGAGYPNQQPATGYAGYPNQQPGTGYGYPPPPQAQGYHGGYPQPGYGYPQPGYGYAPPAGYGYQQPPMQAVPPKKKKNGMGMGLGLGAGLLGGLLVGEMVSDVGEMAAYSDGYGDAMGDMGDMGGFDF